MGTGTFNNAVKMSAGTATVGSEWVRVHTSRSYELGKMVVIATPVAQVDLHVVAQVRDRRADSFEIRVVRPESDLRPTVPVMWLAMNEGTHVFDGIHIEAFHVQVVDDTDADRPGRQVELRHPFVQPVVIGQVTDLADDAEWTFFVASGQDRASPPSSGSVWVDRHRDPDNKSNGSATLLGVIVIEAGTFELNGWSFEAQVADAELSPAVRTPVTNRPTLAVLAPAGIGSSHGSSRVLTGASADEPFSNGEIRFSIQPIGDAGREQTAVVAINGDRDAARFALQAGWGGHHDDLRDIFRTGYGSWIDRQADQPVSELTPYMDYLADAPFGNDGPAHINGGGNNKWDTSTNLTTQWMRNVVWEPDQLRQRMAFCLSQIFVASASGGELKVAGASMADYYDTLSRHALGNYRDLLSAVTYHPVMAYYLTYVGNQAALPDGSRLPDENYARELLQLFTIGLWELHADGSLAVAVDENGVEAVDADGYPLGIPTYDSEDIATLGALLTGLFYGPRPDGLGITPSFGQTVRNESFVDSWHWSGRKENNPSVTYERYPLAMYEDEHDQKGRMLFGQKVYAARGSGVVPIPADRNEITSGGLRQIEDVLDIIFEHPNVPPFFAKRLIQQLVTSNPTPEYVGRVSEVFRDDGAGTRGNLHAVVRAVLLDDEARDYFEDEPTRGKFVEPLVHIGSVARGFRLGVGQPRTVDDPATPVFWDNRLASVLGQMLLHSPSVFNFFPPDHTLRPGVLAPEAALLGPRSLGGLERVLEAMLFPADHDLQNRMAPDFTAEQSLLAANDPKSVERFLDRLDILVMHGQMSPETRSTLALAVARADDDLRTAVILAALAPDAYVLI